jgi:5-methylcytosine-specific restriction endonuclease McrA
MKARVKFSSGLKFKVYSRSHGKCVICGCKTSAEWKLLTTPGSLRRRFYLWDAEIHHKKPVIDGGTNDISNLILLCIPCHKAIHKYGTLNARLF